MKRHLAAVLALTAVLAAVTVTSTQAATGQARASAAAAPGTNPAFRTFTNTHCPRLILYAARGSGDTATVGNNFLGDTINSVYAHLRKTLGGGDNVGAASDVYDAVDVPVAAETGGVAYGDSVRGGVENAVNDIQTLNTDCPMSHIAVIGWSQGADVLRRALSRLSGLLQGTESMSGRYLLDGAYFFGDPNFSSTETVQSSGDFASPSVGLRPYRSGLTKLAKSPRMPAMWWVTYCHGRDPVCQFGFHTKTQHLNYAARDGAGVAWRIAAFRNGAFRNRVTVGSLTQTPVAYVNRAEGCRLPRTARVLIWPLDSAPVQFVFYVDGVSKKNVTATSPINPVTVDVALPAPTRKFPGDHVVTVKGRTLDGLWSQETLWERTMHPACTTSGGGSW